MRPVEEQNYLTLQQSSMSATLGVKQPLFIVSRCTYWCANIDDGERIVETTVQNFQGVKQPRQSKEELQPLFARRGRYIHDLLEP